MNTKQFTQQQKLTILKSAAKIGIKPAAKIADVHYTTVYDWRRKLESLGEEAFLSYQPSYPGRGIKEISAANESAVLDSWKSNPGFGPGQVRGQLRRQGITVSIRSVRKIMQSNGYRAATKKSIKDKPQRFEARRPLELAQMDILEFFINKAKVYLILLIDDFSRFIPCGVHEAAFILDPFFPNKSDIKPHTVYGDTHAQSLTVFGLAYLLGIQFMPRIVRWKDLKIYRFSGESYPNIDPMFTSEEINEDLIAKHLVDMQRVAVSILEGRISQSFILRRLTSGTRKNKLYYAFQGLGKVVRSAYLLKYLRKPEIRRTVNHATTVSER